MKCESAQGKFHIASSFKRKTIFSTSIDMSRRPVALTNYYARNKTWLLSALTELSDKSSKLKFLRPLFYSALNLWPVTLFKNLLFKTCHFPHVFICLAHDNAKYRHGQTLNLSRLGFSNMLRNLLTSPVTKSGF